jgi:hypothetical protein
MANIETVTFEDVLHLTNDPYYLGFIVALHLHYST